MTKIKRGGDRPAGTYTFIAGDIVSLYYFHKTC